MIKKDYKQLISKILYEVDIIDLVSCGVPADEYEHEAEMIVERIDDNINLSIKDIAKIVFDVFKKQFGSGIDLFGNVKMWKFKRSSKYEIVAEKIKNIL